MERAAALLERLVRSLCRNWTWIYLAGLGCFLGGALAAPLLAWAGLDRPASWLYAAYRLTCHQLPHHSWFIAGQGAAYTWPEVLPHLPWASSDPRLAFHHPLRDRFLGYQVAICQRDIAIWSALLIGSIALLARRAVAPIPQPIRLRSYALAALPMAIDAGTQLIGWRESTPLLRSLTGGLFGLATAALVVPLLAEGFAELAGEAAVDRGAKG